ncbi:MAG: signal peptidase I [Epsilonproteobacteria bacterium]|nr:signal peptidase I [Campylobacterota bacterium]
MNRVITRFEKIKRLFLNKEGYFEEVIREFENKKSKRLYQEASQLLAKARNEQERLSELKRVIERDDLAGVDEFKALLKSFKKNYRDLVAITKPFWKELLEELIIPLAIIIILQMFVFGLYHVPSGSAEPNLLVGDRIWGNKTAYYFNPVQRGDLVLLDNPEFVYDKSSKFKYLWQRYIGIAVPFLGIAEGPEVPNMVKRVIAIPGDTIEGRVDENNHPVIYLNGEVLKEPYVNQHPLIVLKKTAGLIDQSWVPFFKVPDFIRRQEKLVRYTHDITRPYDKQPYYCVEEDEIKTKPGSNMPILIQPNTSTSSSALLWGSVQRINRDIFGPITIPEGKYWVMGDSRKNSADSRWFGLLDRSLIYGRASFVLYSVDSEESFWIFDLIKHPVAFWTKHVRWNRFFKPLWTYNRWKGSKTEE